MARSCQKIRSKQPKVGENGSRSSRLRIRAICGIAFAAYQSRPALRALTAARPPRGGRAPRRGRRVRLGNLLTRTPEDAALSRGRSHPASLVDEIGEHPDREELEPGQEQDHCRAVDPAEPHEAPDGE